MRKSAIGSVLGAALALAACDPCFGTVECRTAPLLVASGQIVRAEDGHGVRDVRVDLIRSGGVGLAADSGSAITDVDGFWRVAIPANAIGSVTADFAVTSPDASYRVYGVALRTNTRAGESNLLDRWVTKPYFPIIAQLHWRGSVNDPVANAAVEFRRTGGVELGGTDPGSAVFSGTTDGRGFVTLASAQSSVFARNAGETVGDLSVNWQGHTSVTGPVRLRSQYEYHRSNEIIVLGVGPASHWVVQTKNRATGKGQPGVQVRFTRSGGVPITPETGVVVSDSDGNAVIPVRALDSGTVTMDLEVTPPAPGASFTLRDVRATTYADEFPRLCCVVDVMPHISYVGIVKIAADGASGVPYEFRRTGGIALQTNVVSGVSDRGTFFLNLTPLTAGEVVGDLTFRSPAPFRPFVVHNVRLFTQDGATTELGRFLWVFDLDFAQPVGPPGTTIEFLPSTAAAAHRFLPSPK
jgi:hypothetical protein